MEIGSDIFNVYMNGGQLKERLILNHLIVFYNVFPVYAGTRILFYKIEEHFWPMLKTFLIFLDIFWIFSVFLGFLSKLLRLLLKVTKVTIGHRKSPKMGQNSKKKTLFLSEGQKKPWPKAEALRRS